MSDEREPLRPGETWYFSPGAHPKRKGIVPRDVFRLAREDPVVAQCLDAWEHGFWSLEEALMQAILKLAEQKQQLVSDAHRPTTSSHSVVLYGVEAVAAARGMSEAAIARAVEAERRACADMAAKYNCPRVGEEIMKRGNG